MFPPATPAAAAAAYDDDAPWPAPRSPSPPPHAATKSVPQWHSVYDVSDDVIGDRLEDFGMRSAAVGGASEAAPWGGPSPYDWDTTDDTDDAVEGDADRAGARPLPSFPPEPAPYAAELVDTRRWASVVAEPAAWGEPAPDGDDDDAAVLGGGGALAFAAYGPGAAAAVDGAPRDDSPGASFDAPPFVGSPYAAPGRPSSSSSSTDGVGDSLQLPAAPLPMSLPLPRPLPLLLPLPEAIARNAAVADAFAAATAAIEAAAAAAAGGRGSDSAPDVVSGRESEAEAAVEAATEAAATVVIEAAAAAVAGPDAPGSPYEEDADAIASPSPASLTLESAATGGATYSESDPDSLPAAEGGMAGDPPPWQAQGGDAASAPARSPDYREGGGQPEVGWA